MDAGVASLLGTLFAGVLSLIGVVITNNKSNTKIQNDMRTQQAVNDERLKELTREVRVHNGFAERVPVLENDIKSLERRVNTLESFHRN